MTLKHYPIELILPHARPMILIDRVVGRDADRIVTEVTVRPDAPFFRPGYGIAAHVAMEWMAQSCGAYVGAQTLDAGLPVRVGFLLGTRDFNSRIAWFELGNILTVTAVLTYRQEDVAVFDCNVRRRDEEVATAQLTVFQPEDMATTLASQGIDLTS
jgi:predicted hotdog family 3-hydroxylacyl-ACP dehydratase